MKAAIIHEFGDFDVLKYEEVPTPEPRAGHVLVKVLAAGVNRLDHYLREGTVVPELPFPHILGADAAGEVAALGDGAIGIEIGDRVVVVPGYPQNEEDYDVYPASQAPSFALPGLHIPGTYAQYIEVPARYLLKDETGLTPEEVATLPVALATAVRAVKEVGGVKAGDKVLVQAGASGSGSMQIQVAKALGAEVATTIRNESKADFVREIGADLVINTRNEDLVKRVQEWTDGGGADVVIDNLAGDVLAKSIEAAKPTGTIVAFGFAAGPEVKFDIRSLFFQQKVLKGSMASDKSDLEFGLKELLPEGKIRPLLDRTLSLREAADAHRLIANNEVAGNIALLPWAE
jgi:NADPH:quinone reductase-like Zn-dependent oxidoreductase